VETFVYEAEPGTIAMTYRPGAAFVDPVPDEPAAVAAAVKAANRKVAAHGVVAQAPFPEPDFPRASPQGAAQRGRRADEGGRPGHVAAAAWSGGPRPPHADARRTRMHAALGAFAAPAAIIRAYPDQLENPLSVPP
jgi:hypothetical protein